MLVGEAPGAQEDLRGEPFVGAAGRLLDSLLEGIGLRRDEVFITNVIKCRPPGNRDPEEAEVRACARYLDAQIATIAPAVIVILGRHALARLLPAHGPISRVHGSPVDLGGRTYVPVYHPAAALHNPHLEKDLRADFEAVRDVLHLRLARDGAAEPAPADADQLSLL
jgi:DNA polymerase